MEGYWKEYDNENDELVHICEIDEKGNYNGMCYSFENDRLIKISKWENGIEIDYSGYYILYDEPHQTWIEGYSLEGVVLNMTRLSEMEGYWKEYDNENNLISICKRNENGQYEGICYFYKDDKLIKISKWENGKEVSMNGSCKFYDEPHKTWYEGGYENGLREGKCREYNVNGQLIYDGFYINGNKLIPMKKRKHIWKEIDANNQVIRICQIDKEGRYDGVSYLYNDGKIHRISEWKNGKETRVLKLFSGDRMTEMLEGKKRYSGGYIDTFESNYQREGEGEEYDIDGKTLIYRGSIKNGKRNGQGCSYKDMQVVYNGKWIDGYKERNYYLYMALAFAFMAVISTLCFMWNVYVGLFVSGFCLLYFIYLMKICCEWKMNIVYSSAGLIFGICIVSSLIMLWNKNELLKCITIFVIGLFIIYITFLFFYYCEKDLRVFYAGIGYIIDIVILACAYVIIDNTSSKTSIIVNGIGSCLVMIIILRIMIIGGYDSIKPMYLYDTLIILGVICIIVSAIIIRKDSNSSIYLGVYLISSIFDISFAFSEEIKYLAVPIIIFIYNCFAIVLSFFGNAYVIIITVGISFCSMVTVWALIEKGEDKEVLIVLGILAAIFDLYSCIAVNMDTATWIKVIYWIFFGILGFALGFVFLGVCFS